MSLKLKPIRTQVIVITGATSGIGRATALEAARRGAKVVVAARDAEGLDGVVKEIGDLGAQGLAVPMSVSTHADHQKLLDAALERFGVVDTWVNNAGVSIFGRSEQVSIEDQRQLFETNFWGIVYGSLVAVGYLKQHGGALINLGSEVSDRAVPLQGAYSASKHAVKGYTEALRVELQDEGAPISITLIKPAAVNTAFVDNAKNYLDHAPQLPPPVYAPEIVADAILFAAEHPRRDIFIGSASKATSASNFRAPGLIDRVFGPMLIRMQESERDAGDREGALYASRRTPRLHGRTEQMVRRRSLYTLATTRARNGVLAGLAASTLALVVLGMTHRYRR